MKEKILGQVSEDILNGICCQFCGVWMPEVFDKKSDIFKNPPGHPRTCKNCLEEKIKGLESVLLVLTRKEALALQKRLSQNTGIKKQNQLKKLKKN